MADRIGTAVWAGALLGLSAGGGGRQAASREDLADVAARLPETEC